MEDILLRAAALSLVVAIGIVLRKTGFVPDDTGGILKKIVMHVTLPAAIITNFTLMESVDPALLAVALLGLLANLPGILCGLFLSRRDTRREQAMFILGVPGFNIGAFGLPFVQSFLPAAGTAAACMFDAGNSVMCTGLTYAFAAEYVAAGERAGGTGGRGSGFTPASFLKRLLSSVPFLTYSSMFTLSLLKIRFPMAVVTLLEPLAKANPFTAMLMLGLLFEADLKKETMGRVMKVIAGRVVCGIVMGLAVWYLLPFEKVIRQAVVLVLFTPMSAVAPAFTGMAGGDEGLASCAGSVSIIFSILVMTGLLMVLGV